MNSKSSKDSLLVSRYIIIYKFLLGLLELALGVGMIFFGKQAYELYLNFKAQELLEDTNDLLIKVVETVVPFIFEHQGYVVMILILLGLVKMIGAAALFKRKHWGLDLLIILTLSLLPFEGYHLIASPSPSKFIYFFINIIIALFLVNFNPKGYFEGLRTRVRF